MSYTSRYGKRSPEQASKASHHHLINDPHIREFMNNCGFPKAIGEVQLNPALVLDAQYPADNLIDHIVAIDGSLSTVPVRKSFPSSLVTFFQFGELLLNTSDLDDMSALPFIPREAMEKMNELERTKLVLPTKNVARNNMTLTQSVRSSIHEFFERKEYGANMLATLHWLIYEVYTGAPREVYSLSGCPYCDKKDVPLKRTEFDAHYIVRCPNCGQEIYLTDVFRLHEVVNEEHGAEGILGYLTNVIEQMNIVHIIHNIMLVNPGLLSKFLFIKDGPLAFFGQTANMHDPVRRLCNYLFDHHDLFLVGVEKTGAFVEHADEIKDLLKPGQALMLDNRHIYTYILPGDPNAPDAHGSYSYYSAKLIFKSFEHRMHVLTLPVENKNIPLNPQSSDFRNLDVILLNIERLKCDMYDNAIIPVALANKLISLSSHPSSIILEKFAKSSIK